MKRFIAAGAILASLVAIGVISSSNAEQSGSTIYACTTPKNGNLIRVSPQPVTCPTGSTPIQWGAGAQGPKGDKGDVGPAGPQGLAGYSYEQALASINDNTSDTWATYPLNLCLGGGFEYLEGANGPSDSLCLKRFTGKGVLSFLSVVSTIQNNSYIFWIVPECPWNTTSWWRNHPQVSGELIPNQKPISYSVTQDTSCLVLGAYGYSQYQLIGSFKN